MTPTPPGFSALARIIHEHFCCNRGFTATTSLSAGVLAPQSLDVLSSTPRSLVAVLARLAWRLHDFATKRPE